MQKYKLNPYQKIFFIHQRRTMRAQNKLYPAEQTSKCLAVDRPLYHHVGIQLGLGLRLVVEFGAAHKYKPHPWILVKNTFGGGETRVGQRREVYDGGIETGLADGGNFHLLHGTAAYHLYAIRAKETVDKLVILHVWRHHQYRAGVVVTFEQVLHLHIKFHLVGRRGEKRYFLFLVFLLIFFHFF